jgi:hypothetical protein
MATWHSANVLRLGAEAHQIWQFSAGDNDVSLVREENRRPGEPLPERIFRKDWQALWEKKLNVAWLPADKVFLRVVQLPAAEFSELLSMVDFQLEKISPLPVAQIVWSVELLPARSDGQQTVIVVIVARNVVEEFLGELEGKGFLADRLEFPLLDQLLATRPTDDGVWIYPGATTSAPCLLAWWYGGILRNLTLVSLPVSGDLAASLNEQLSQVAWAGELEGWLTTAPRVHLVATPDVAAAWEPMARNFSDQPIEIITPLTTAELAALTARRSVQGDSRASLLPPEFSARYRQQFVDRLWMRGLGGVVSVYLIGVLIYFGVLAYFRFENNKLQAKATEKSLSYTNAMQMRDLVAVLKEQVNLKYAALDCWKAAAELLPVDVTLTQMNFQRGNRLYLVGTAPREHASAVLDYNEALRKATTLDGRLLFKPGGVETPLQRFAPGPTGETAFWSFNCDLNRLEPE